MVKPTKIINSGCKFIRNKDYRFLIIDSFGLFNNWPDAKYLTRKFRALMGKDLDLENPNTFNEKLQWLKINDRRPEFTMMVDKYLVRQYVEDIIGGEYLIPLLGIWREPNEINFDALPNQFVLKCTHDSGGLVVCRDKSRLDLSVARNKIKSSLKSNYYYHGREWPYKNVKPRIIAEKFMEEDCNGENGLTDYKFFCFNSTPQLLYVSRGLEDHATATISFYDMNGNLMPFRRRDYQPIADKVSLPDNFSKMIEIAQQLAASVNCPFVRIDLYSIHGNIYFSEITFTPCSGMMPFEPSNWDNILGDWIKLPK